MEKEIARLRELVWQQGAELNRRNDAICKLNKEADYWMDKAEEKTNQVTRLKSSIGAKKKAIFRTEKILYEAIEESNYWELEAKKHCSKLGEMRIFMEQKIN